MTPSLGTTGLNLLTVHYVVKTSSTSDKYISKILLTTAYISASVLAF